ncbi:TPA: hypothetical protein RG728_003031 [Morganella morganii subsp. morganii]|uniref:hypothetical protein n=1 Tax=Morganella morganii TaxID=582 RepID=UPI0022ACEDA3|nr:hypothetical protein [Morganella morganii]HDU8693887.1 hypothetical protein [Morganella morganii subsp. morganii]
MNGLKLSKLIISLLLIFSLFITVIFLFLPGSREYTKLNIVYYYLYTFDEIKEMPIISNDYKINHEPVDGNSAEFNDIVFFNVDIKRNNELFDYVKRSGFSGEFDQYRKRERWVKDNTKIDIIINESEQTTSFLAEKN